MRFMHKTAMSALYKEGCKIKARQMAQAFIRAEGLIPRRLRRNMRVLKPTATTL